MSPHVVDGTVYVPVPHDAEKAYRLYSTDPVVHEAVNHVASGKNEVRKILESDAQIINLDSAQIGVNL